ncbi:MAG TPA: hypothetical protein VM715_17285 [Candidatus Acidoferrum sp.]|nr:hypothetical protein [Candidatus Acidoferrum sp.]
MAKGNLQAQARDLGLPDDGTADELRNRISDTGQEPNDDYDSSYSDSEEVTPTGETVEVEGESAGAVGARTEEDPTSVEQSEEDAQAAAVVIPEYEQRVAAAAAAGDDSEIARVQEEYWQARQDRAQKDREERESESEE